MKKAVGKPVKKSVKPKTKSKKIKKESIENGVAKTLDTNDMPQKQTQRHFAMMDPLNRYTPKVKMGRNPVYAICVPYITKAKVSMDWSRCYKGLQGLLGSTAVEILVPDKTVAEARNECVRQALAQNVSHIFFLGSDVLPPGVIISKLLSHEKDIITGVYWTKGHPSRPYIWRGNGLRGPYMDWKYGELFKIQYCGVDCTLINADVFRNMSEPWFSTDWNYDDTAPPSGITTEDFYFYEKAAQLGYEFWCDSSMQCIHQDRDTLQMYGLTSDMMQMMFLEEHKGADKKMVADVRLDSDTPMELSLMVPDDGIIHRFDMREDMAPDFRADPISLPAKNGTYDYLHADNVLEYYEEEVVVKVLRELLRIVKVDGEFKIIVPDVKKWDFKNREFYKYKCGIDEQRFLKLFNRTKMVKGLKVEKGGDSNTIIATGKIKTNRTWEILRSDLNETEICKS